VLRLLSAEKNELLTRTGAGTPCGELMRRYWHPIALAEELPPGGAPLPVRVFGEDYVLFRDEQGRPGLLDIHCAHRGADLSYGRLEDGGLRCIYHGWLYDVQGRCLEQPGEPAGSTFCEKIRQPAYPVVERADALWAYLGPGEPPLFPNYEWLTLPTENVFALKLFHECNFQQGNEGNIDYLHLSFLHYNRGQDRGDEALPFNSRGAAPWRELVEGDRVPTGLRVCRIRQLEGKKHLYMGTYLMPSAFAFDNSTTDGYSINWHVPIDDVTHWKYTFLFSREHPLDKAAMRQGRNKVDERYHGLLNKSNRYGQDRASMKEETYSGIGLIFQAQDACVTEGAGPIQDRTREHLGVSDVTVIQARELMFEAIQTVQDGQEPQHVLRRAEDNRFTWPIVWSGTVDDDTDWRAFFQGMDRQAESQLQPAGA
jgi:phthalate 4,5-dioxygenase